MRVSIWAGPRCVVAALAAPCTTETSWICSLHSSWEGKSGVQCSGTCLTQREPCHDCYLGAQMCLCLVGMVLCSGRGSPSQGWLQGDVCDSVRKPGERGSGALGRSHCLLRCLQVGTITCRDISREPKAQAWCAAGATLQLVPPCILWPLWVTLSSLDGWTVGLRPIV